MIYNNQMNFKIKVIMDDFDLNLCMAISYYHGDNHLRDYNKSKELFDEILKHNPNNITALHYLGCIYLYDLHDNVKAKKYFLNAIKLNNANSLYIIAKEKLVDNEEIISFFEKAANDGHKNSLYELINEFIRNKYKKEKQNIIELSLKLYQIDFDPKILTNLERIYTYQDLMEDYLILKQENQDLKNEILYRPGGEGYLDAKSHFEKLLNQ